jgi:hypothetical protein
LSHAPVTGHRPAFTEPGYILRFRKRHSHALPGGCEFKSSVKPVPHPDLMCKSLIQIVGATQRRNLCLALQTMDIPAVCQQLAPDKRPLQRTTLAVQCCTHKIIRYQLSNG